jgi:hypothetical protein
MCPLARMPSLPHILTTPITSVCFFSVIFNLVLFYFYFILFTYLFLFSFFSPYFSCLFSVLFLLIEYCKGGVPIRQFIHASGLLTSIY